MNISRDTLVKSVFNSVKISEGHYQCPSPHMGGDFYTSRLFGGQAVCQAYRAIKEQIGETFSPSTLHYRFISPGKPDVPLDYKIEQFGKSHRVYISQNGKLIGTAQCFEYDSLFPTYSYDQGYIPPPLEISPLSEIITEHGPSQYAPKDILLVHTIVYDLRVVEWGMCPIGKTPRNTIWAKFHDDCLEYIPQGCGLQAALLLSDYFIIQIVMDICNSYGFFLPTSASLSHSVRFHKRSETVTPHDWFLFRVECESIIDHRAKIVAHVYDSNKEAVVSIIQEAYCPYEKRKQSKM